MGITDDRRRRDRVNQLAALRETKLLDSPPASHFDRITSLVSNLLNCGVALVSLVDEDRQFFLSECGLAEPYATLRQTPLSHSFCQHVVAAKQPLIIPDSREHALVAGNGAIQDLGVIAYLGFPLSTREGMVIGSICAIDGKRRDWTSTEIDLLGRLAAICEDQIDLSRHAQASQILAQERGVLAREYHHRVKNALAVSSALVRLSAKDSQSVADLVDKAGGRLNALANAHDSLMSDSDSVDLKDLLAKLLLPYCLAGAAADVDGPSVNLRQWQVTPMCLFIHELATNSVKYGAFHSHSRVSVRWDCSEPDRAVIVWNEQITQKPAGAEAPGFGSKLLQIAAVQLSGTYEAEWKERELVIRLAFPLASKEA